VEKSHLSDIISGMTILVTVYVIVCVLLIAAILLQSSTAGVGGIFGGGESANVKTTRRGAEKRLLDITIALAIAFGLLSLSFLLF